jgi:uncharacterized protein YndB with AHSA1/START domain
MANEPIVIERTFKRPAPIIWKAISNREEMKKWYFDLKEFKAEVGFQFSFLGGDEKQFVHLCEVREVIPDKKLSYTWKYKGYEGESLVTFELLSNGDFTTVILTHSGLESFPPIADFDKKNFIEGWTHIIGTSLKEYLEKN